ncbi:MAG TPA: NAD(P)/FAD-dependent oxidoreductase [Pyrinomonadaceae bacterium]|nr:NAD(P)/FAD-dependent oxidoreductase [Pyrinomonadaceae bacterium]
MTFDVLIVGAGPAGSFAAERLARAGARVMMFDGRPQGQPKPCGGGVTAKALKAWPHLLNAVGRTVTDLELYSPSGKRLRLELEEPFAIYSRIAFDAYLRDRALQAGARICAAKVSTRSVRRTERGWTLHIPGGGQLSGHFLVGADGANSVVAKMLAGSLAASEMEVAFGYRAPLPPGEEAPTVVAFLPGWAGYAWAFPRLDHVSFGIATTQDAFAHEPLEALLWDFMLGYYRQREDPKANLWRKRKVDQQRDIRMRTELARVAERYAARIPGVADKTWESRKVCGADWALLGDAAGFADPVTGEGIYYALRSAELLAECYLTGAPESYEHQWREDFGRELKRAAQMRCRFYGNFWGAPFTERMIEFARGHRGIKRVLGDLVAGQQSYTDLKKKLALNALRPL